MVMHSPPERCRQIIGHFSKNAKQDGNSPLQIITGLRGGCGTGGKVPKKQ
jgi:hypothetical protein